LGFADLSPLSSFIAQEFVFALSAAIPLTIMFLVANMSIDDYSLNDSLNDYSLA
jgi:hypothetical protein